jgi:AcrR family transcriptional regulator
VRPDKRQAVVDAALAVFARDGFARASMDGIAAHAGVSVRTIYNHFPDKATLFHAVMTTSSARVAAAQIAALHEHLGADGPAGATGDLEADLVAFALAWVAPMPDFADHVTLVRQIEADARHIPREALEAWQDAGPRRVRGEVARRLRAFADAGLLDVDDADLAAHHLALLLNPAHRGTDVPPGGRPPRERRRLVEAGVRTFLHGHVPRA